MDPDTVRAGEGQAAEWDFFDRIYCITLEDRQDRRREAQGQFAAIGLTERIEFMVVRRHPSNIEQGIYESHMACLRKGLASGARRIAVFEDDVLFDRYDPNRFRQGLEFLNKHPEWQVLLFGALIRSSRKTASPALRKVEYRSLAHAYALNRPYAEELAYVPWSGKAADVLFRPPTEHVYAIDPMFAFQSNASSDNEKYFQLDRFRRLCGGLERIQKANEFYYRRLPAIYAVHALVLFAILYFLVR